MKGRDWGRGTGDSGTAMESTAACYHCGDPLPTAFLSVVLDGAERAMCCAGCAGAAAWIRDAGLDDYYRLRQRDGSRVATEAADFSAWDRDDIRSEEHTSELQSLMRISYAVFCLKK